MLPQTDTIHGVAPAETDIIPPATKEDQILSRLNKNYRLSKAQQIVRLLKDQDALNQRFRDCDLLDDDDDAKDNERSQQDEDEDAWSMQEEGQSDADDSDLSENEAERRAARRVALRKHRNSIDPGRCKTSMGFHNQAEVTEIPYDTDSDNVAGVDSAGSTPRAGGIAGIPHQPVKQTLASVSKGANNSRTSVYQKKMSEGDAKAREMTISEERMVQSARSSRPKTSLTSCSSTRSRYYRQQPHPESHYQLPSQTNDPSQLHQLPQPRGVGETRQSIISRLDPHHPMVVRPFCENRAHEEAARLGVHQLSPQSTTPRGGVRHQGNNAAHLGQSAVTLFDMSPSLSKDVPTRSSSRRTTGAGSHGANTTKSTSFVEHPRMMPANRTLLSIDSSPIHLGEVSPRGRVLAEDPNGSRRPRSTRVKKRVGELPRGPVPTSMHVLGDRGHPSMAVMKLPPLETVSKGGSGRDLVCVGKD